MKKTARIGFWVVLLGFTLAAPTAASYALDDAMVIEIPPKMAVGDTLVYQGVRDLDDVKSGERPKWTSKQVVTEVKDDGGFVTTVETKKGPTIRTYNKNGNIISKIKSGKLTAYNPFWPIYRYPMKIGDKYRMNFTQTWGDKGNAHFSLKINVISWENITVPAGTFKALKVEAWGSYEHPPNYIPASITYTVWLAPEIKMRAQLLISDERWWNGGSEYHYESLKKFSVE